MRCGFFHTDCAYWIVKTNAIALNVAAIACAAASAAPNLTDVTITLPTTTVVLVDTTSGKIYGQPVQFYASVSSNVSKATPTGSVAFSVNGTAQATVPLSNGAAVWTTSSVPSENNQITATYSGNYMFASSQGSVSWFMAPAQTSTALSDPNNPSVYSQAPAVTVTVTNISTPAPPAGSVELECVSGCASPFGSLVPGSGPSSTSSIQIPASLLPGTYQYGAV